MANDSKISSVGDVIKKYKIDDTNKYISCEFQKYAYDLAKELNDLSHKSLYMRLAKNTPRALLENARNFVKDAYKVDSKGKLFMWKLAQLNEEIKKRRKEE